MVTKQELIIEIRKTIGVKFVDNGFSLEGLDCIGTIMYPAFQLGLITDEQVAHAHDKYLRIAIDSRLVRACEKYFKRVTDNKMEICDVILFRPKGFKFATHVALYVGNDKIIHSQEKYNKVVETHLGQRLKEEIVRVYRFREFT